MMIKTSHLRAALEAFITSTGLVEKVKPYAVADLSSALECVRDSNDSLAVIVPSRDELSHVMALEDDNIPARVEIRNEFEILLTARDLSHGDDGVRSCVDLKDDLLAALLWSDLAVPGIICLPLETEPMIIEIDERRGREAWKITLQIRQQILS